MLENREKAGFKVLSAKRTNNIHLGMRVWNQEDVSEFHVNLGIISIKLLCKSLVMDEILYEEIIERKGHDRLKKSHISNWEVKCKRMQRNRQKS